MSRETNILNRLENELSLKQLQITSLLNITQAINENLPQEDLFRMYKDFLTWELSIEKIALFIKEDKNWKLSVGFNLEDEAMMHGLPKIFIHYNRIHTVKPGDDQSLQEFEFIIPVYHKKEPIAYSLVKGVKRGEDIFNNIQLITSITNIIAVAIENKRLVRTQIAQEKEMEFATEVTKMLIPAEMPQGPNFELANVYRPHYKVGGDYIDFLKYSEDRICFCIADVSGKGMAAAMIMANFQALVQNMGMQYRDLETLIIALNQTVARITGGEKYLTFFIALADLKKKKLYYVNAGHVPPILLINGKSQELKATCTIIGHFNELPETQEGVIDLSDDMILVAYTDGLVDIKNNLDQNYSTTKLNAFILDHATEKAQLFANNLMDHILDFGEGRELPDDIAILVFKYYKR